MKISEHLDTSELKCKCGKCEFSKDDVVAKTISKETVAWFEEIRKKLGKAITVDCALRCVAHNAAVGGEPDSQHTKGTAMDISYSGMDYESFYKLVKGIIMGKNHYGLGYYPTKHFVHIDSRAGKSTWTK